MTGVLWVLALAVAAGLYATTARDITELVAERDIAARTAERGAEAVMDGTWKPTPDVAVTCTTTADSRTLVTATATRTWNPATLWIPATVQGVYTAVATVGVSC